MAKGRWERIKERWAEKPLSIELTTIKRFNQENYQYIMLRLKAYYFSRALKLEDKLRAENFLIGRINPLSGKLDYSIGDGLAPKSMGYQSFGYLKSSSEWIIFFGPWPADYKLLGETILVRLNAKGRSTVQRGAIEELMEEKR
jgi:hypothetical protein